MPSVVSVAPMPAMGCDGAFSVLVRSRQAKHDAHEESKEGGSLLTNTILLFVDADGLRLSVVVLAQTASLVPTHVLSAQQRLARHSAWAHTVCVGPGAGSATFIIFMPTLFSSCFQNFCPCMLPDTVFLPMVYLAFLRNVGGELRRMLCVAGTPFSITWLAK